MSLVGVTLDMLHANAFFVSGITDMVLQSEDLKKIKNFDEIFLLIRRLRTMEWFTDKMRYQIERYTIESFNGI